jgi:hypothetical protein
MDRRRVALQFLRQYGPNWYPGPGSTMPSDFYDNGGWGFWRLALVAPRAVGPLPVHEQGRHEPEQGCRSRHGRFSSC